MAVKPILLAALVAVALVTAPAEAATTFTVNSANDADDTSCDATHCSLREAIDAANALAGADAIDFPGPMVITPATALPVVTEDVTINGSSAGGFSCGVGIVWGVELDGGGATFNGLRLGADADGSQVCSLNVKGFDNGIVVRSDMTTISGNKIGTTLDGQTADANSGHGVSIIDADDVTIGGSPSAENVISGNGANGVEIQGDSDGALVLGNDIGTDSFGEDHIPNDIGVNVSTDAGTSTTIGEPDDDPSNIISGNSVAGVVVDGPGVVVTGNLIGAAEDLGETVAGQPDGINVTAAGSGATIGGTAENAGNVIAGNSDDGVHLATDTTDVDIMGNTIGLDADGTTVVANGTGIHVDGADSATVSDNVISGNTASGLVVGGAVGGDAGSTIIEGNLIGTDATGTLDRGNGQLGIYMFRATNTVIGGTTAAARNVISGNDGGIVMELDVNGTVVLGNHIGVATDGVTPIGNTDDGIRLNTTDAPLVIGGTGLGMGNVIAANGGNGIAVNGPADGAAWFANSVFDNGAVGEDVIGINLSNDGVTDNDAGDVDEAGLPNGYQNFPVLTGADNDGTTTTVTGTLDSTPGAQFRIELFSSAACDPSGHGQAEQFLGATNVTAGAGPTAFAADVPAAAGERQITATATNLSLNESSELSACFTAPAAPPPPPAEEDDAGGDQAPPPGDPPPTNGILPPPPGILPPPVVTPKLPAKIRVLRAGVDDGVLDMLVQITSHAVASGARLSLDYQSSGRHTRFTVPITSTQLKIRKRLPGSQRGKDTGIVEIAYAGSPTVNADDVRLRAADGKSRLVRKTATVSDGVLRVDGTISTRARGVVRIRLEHNLPDGTTGFLHYTARIRNGKWSLSEPLAGIAGGQLSIQFTGYEAANLRGEQTAKQVP